MAQLSLDQATAILDGALRTGREMGLRALTVAVLDDGGHLMALKREDGAGGALRPQVAIGKAFGAIGMGQSSRVLGEMARERPSFIAALINASDGRLVPVPGGVLIADGAGTVLGAVGVTGDSSDNDEAAAVSGIKSAGLQPVV